MRQRQLPNLERETHMNQDLFRKEAIEAQSQMVFGNTLILAPWTVKATIYLMVGLFFYVLLYLLMGSYSRTEKAYGFLVPNLGMVKVYAPRKGIVDQVLVKEGDAIEANSPLFELGESYQDQQGARIADLKVQELESILTLLEERQTRIPQVNALEKKRLIDQAQASERSISILEDQLHTARQRLAIRQNRQNRISALAKDRIISQDDFDQGQDVLLQLRSSLKTDEQALIREKDQLSEIQAKLESFDSQLRDQELQLFQQIARTRQEIMDLGLASKQLMRAPLAGVVTAVQSYPGMTADPMKPALAIIPRGSHLEAYLFVPSRATGNLRKDQPVLLQYDAFPYQKYGTFEGVIKDISGSIISPKDITDMDLANSDGPLYRVIVTLKDTPALRLQAGMSLHADILLERRRLWRWLFDPLTVRVN